MKFETYQLAKELDSFNYQQVQDDILAILEKGSSAIVDMTACKYVSSTGLRVLLYSKKIAASKGLRLCLVGVRCHGLQYLLRLFPHDGRMPSGSEQLTVNCYA